MIVVRVAFFRERTKTRLDDKLLYRPVPSNRGGGGQLVAAGMNLPDGSDDCGISGKKCLLDWEATNMTARINETIERLLEPSCI